MILLICYTICQATILALNHSYIMNTRIFGNNFELIEIGISLLVEGILVWNCYREFKSKAEERKLEELRYAAKLEQQAQHSRMTQKERLRQKRLDLQKRIQDAKISVIENTEIVNRHPQNYCENIILNTLLEEKQFQCRELHIHLDVKPIYISDLRGINPVHLCSALSNLLDNAIEAVSALEEEKGRIEVYIYQKKRYLIIRVDNPCSEEYRKRKKGPSRGYGSRILRDIAAIYDGSVSQEMNRETGMFSAVMLLRSDQGERDR